MNIIKIFLNLIDALEKMVNFLGDATKVWPILFQDQIRSGDETITSDDLAF